MIEAYWIKGKVSVSTLGFGMSGLTGHHSIRVQLEEPFDFVTHALERPSQIPVSILISVWPVMRLIFPNQTAFLSGRKNFQMSSFSSPESCMSS